MFFEAKKRKDRLGYEKVSLLFSIYVIDLILPSKSFTKDIEPTVLSVCFERGSKISSSKGKTLDLTNYDDERTKDKILLTINETLELCATLYKDPRTGNFQGKEGKLLVRKRKNNKVVKIETFKGIALHSLKLHELASDLGYETTKSREMVLPLQLLDDATVRVIVTTRLLRSDSSDDTMSENSDAYSDASDSSIIGASFSFDSESLFGQHTSPFVNEHPAKAKSRRASAVLSQPTEEDDEPLILNNLDHDFQPTKDKSLSMSMSRSRMSVSSSPRDSSRGVSGRLSRRGDSGDYSGEDDATAAEKLQKEMLMRQEERIKSNEETFSLYQKELENRALRIKRLEMQLSMQSDKIVSLKAEMNSVKADLKGVKEAGMAAIAAAAGGVVEDGATVIKDAASTTQGQGLPPFEASAKTVVEKEAATAVEQPPVCASEMSAATTNTSTASAAAINSTATAIAATSTTATTTTSTATTTAIKPPASGGAFFPKSIGKRLFTSGNSAADSNDAIARQSLSTQAQFDLEKEEMQRLLDLAHNETQQALMGQMAIARELDSCLADLSLMTEDMMRHKGHAEETLREKDEETAAAQEAAAEAVRANMRRAELDGEMRFLVAELVDSKMSYANMATEVDAERKKNCMLKRRVQLYAEKVAQLEIQCISFPDEEERRTPLTTSTAEAVSSPLALPLPPSSTTPSAASTPLASSLPTPTSTKTPNAKPTTVTPSTAGLTSPTTTRVTSSSFSRGRSGSGVSSGSSVSSPLSASTANTSNLSVGGSSSPSAQSVRSWKKRESLESKPEKLAGVSSPDLKRGSTGSTGRSSSSSKSPPDKTKTAPDGSGGGEFVVSDKGSVVDAKDLVSL